MKESFNTDVTAATQSAISMGISAMNGILVLASAMAARGLLNKADIDFLHHSLLKPLNTASGNEEMMALQTRRIDEACSTILDAMHDLEQGQGS